jgi:hypothetical protein
MLQNQGDILSHAPFYRREGNVLFIHAPFTFTQPNLDFIIINPLFLQIPHIFDYGQKQLKKHPTAQDKSTIY